MGLEVGIVLLGFKQTVQQCRIEQTRQVFLGRDEPTAVEGGWLQEVGSKLGLRRKALQPSASIETIDMPIDLATRETGLSQGSPSRRREHAGQDRESLSARERC
jgi:hypothetical protein